MTLSSPTFHTVRYQLTLTLPRVGVPTRTSVRMPLELDDLRESDYAFLVPGTSHLLAVAFAAFSFRELNTTLI